MKVISLSYIFQVLYVLCFTRPRYQVSVYRTTGPLIVIFDWNHVLALIHVSLMHMCNRIKTKAGLFQHYLLCLVL